MKPVCSPAHSHGCNMPAAWLYTDAGASTPSTPWLSSTTATAVAVVLLSHGVLGVLAPASVYNHAAGMLHPWLWAGLHTGFIALACVSQVVLWKISEGEQDRAGSYYAQLYGSERALISRLHEAERVKKELLALASHELRTPLTGIIGSARTLDRRLEDLDASQVRTLLSHI